MPKEFLTDEQVEKEIERLSSSPNVKLARREMRLKYKRRQTLYTLRALEKRGAELTACGVTMDDLEQMLAGSETEILQKE